MSQECMNLLLLLLYKADKTDKILSDKKKYESFVCKMRKKSIVNVIREKREIKKE